MQQSTLAPCRHHHGRQRALGHAAGALARRRPSGGRGDGAPHRRGRARPAASGCSRCSRSRPTTGAARGPRSAGSCACSASISAIETARCVANGVRLEVIGRRDRIGPPLRRAIEEAQRDDRGRHPAAAPDRARLLLARRHPPRRAVSAAGDAPTRESFGRLVAIVDHGVPGARGRSPDPDRRRAAAERLPALGSRLCRAAVRAADVAGVRAGGAAGRRCGLRLPRAALRRLARRGGGVTMTARTRQGLVAARGRAGPRAHRRRAGQRLVPARLDAALGLGALVLAIVALAQSGVVGAAGLARAAGRAAGAARPRAHLARLADALRAQPRRRPDRGGAGVAPPPRGGPAACGPGRLRHRRDRAGGRRGRGRAHARPLRHRLGLAAGRRPGAPGAGHRDRAGGRGAGGRGVRRAPGGGRPSVRPTGRAEWSTSSSTRCCRTRRRSCSVGWLAAGVLRVLCRTAETPSAPELRRGGTLGLGEVGTVLAVVDLLFLAFVAVQFRYLFGGARARARS